MKYLKLYEEMLGNLDAYCAENGYEVEVSTDQVEYQCIITSDAQTDMFGNPRDGKIVVTAGAITTIETVGEINIPSDVLKKIVKLVEKTGRSYMYAYREERLAAQEES